MERSKFLLLDSMDFLYESIRCTQLETLEIFGCWIISGAFFFEIWTQPNIDANGIGDLVQPCCHNISENLFWTNQIEFGLNIRGKTVCNPIPSPHLFLGGRGENEQIQQWTCWASWGGCLIVLHPLSLGFLAPGSWGPGVWTQNMGVTSDRLSGCPIPC